MKLLIKILYNMWIHTCFMILLIHYIWDCIKQENIFKIIEISRRLLLYTYNNIYAVTTLFYLYSVLYHHVCSLSTKHCKSFHSWETKCWKCYVKYIHLQRCMFQSRKYYASQDMFNCAFSVTFWFVLYPWSVKRIKRIQLFTFHLCWVCYLFPNPFGTLS